MKMSRMRVKVSDLFNGYVNRGEDGVVGFGGLLNIRPAYQREFIYKVKQQAAVINSVIEGFPLSLIYWAKNPDGSYELLDGQQRIMSICSFMSNEFAIEYKNYQCFDASKKEKIQNYELDVCVCEGESNEKIEWFERINIAGEKLTNQELRNAIYTGPWVADAKQRFSKANCAGARHGEGFVSGVLNRQDLLEQAIKWADDEGDIDLFMLKNRYKDSADELWNNYYKVIDWAKQTFTVRREKLTKTVDWGFLYKVALESGKNFKAEVLEKQIQDLLLDPDVTNQKGIYAYLITGDEKYLNIRSFPAHVKQRVFTKQKGVCPRCGTVCKIDKMEADHITPWVEGGKTTEDNCQMLCLKCNREKGKK